MEEAQQGPEVEPSVHGTYDSETHNTRTDANIVPHEYIPSTVDVSNNDWKAMILSLNDTQYQLHQFLVAWANSMLLSPTGQKPNPFHIFLTGGAGVAAEYNIAGHTCHSLFQLPVRVRKDDDYIPLSRERLGSIK
ncbi:hypothetical protein MAR_026758 [Mya arenaria]|uniref:ATP-dependent DNA helicase n=1 Tax=Mya arenaria TaxID=6604 RepID=A0ABY7EVM9_MYAAR|nr:hypothetical protein MAR_026758 [Mya arenaria]